MARTKKKKAAKGRPFEPHPDDPGRKPFRIVDLWLLRDKMILAHGSEKPVHEGRLLFKASLFRPFSPGHPRDGDQGIGRSYWGHSAAAALGFCLRKVRGLDDWPTGRYLALEYETWLEQVRSKELDAVVFPDLPATRPAPVSVPPTPAQQELPVPVDPLAPTDPAPAQVPFGEEPPTVPIRTPLPRRPREERPERSARRARAGPATLWLPGMRP